MMQKVIILKKKLKLKFDMIMIVTLFLENDISLGDIKIEFRLSDKIVKLLELKYSITIQIFL